MEETYSTMRIAASVYDGPDDLKSMAGIYQTTEDESLKSMIVAKCFCDGYYFIRNVVANYYFLTSADKASFVLEEIHKILTNYDTSKDCALTTLLGAYVNRRMRTEITSINYDKNKANNCTAVDLFEDESIFGLSLDEFDEVEFLATLEQSNELTDNELKYCKFVIGEKVTLKNCEIADELGVNNSAISSLKHRLAFKLPQILASSAY